MITPDDERPAAPAPAGYNAPTLRKLVERWWSWYDQSQDDFDDPPAADLVASSFAALNTPAPAPPGFDALRAAAEAALAEAPGRWESIEVDPYGNDDSWIVVFGRAPNGAPVSDSSLMYQSLADYIAAAHPAAVLSLLDALDTAQAGYVSLSRLIEPHHKGATGRDMTADEIAQFIVDCCKRIDDLGDEAERAGNELAELKQQLAASTELLALREAQLFDELNRDDDALRQRNAALEGVAGDGKESGT